MPKPPRADDKFGNGYDRLDSHGNGWRRIEHGQFEALLPQDGKISGKPCNRGLGESGIFILTLVPPVCQRTLGVDIDQNDRPCSGALGLNGQMSRECGLPRSTLLRCQCQYTQDLVPLVCACIQFTFAANICSGLGMAIADQP